MPFSKFLIWGISLLSILLMLWRPRRIAEAYWVCGGALLLVLCGLLPLRQAGGAIDKGVDVYLFLVGMMILSELAREKGVFDWIAEFAAHHADGSPSRLFVMIYLAGTVVTAFLSNDATAVVLTPAVLTIVRRLKLDPKPYLLVCAFIANAASFILPISNPANLVIFDAHMPPLHRWLGFFLLPSLLSVVVTFFCLRVMLRKNLHGKIVETLPRSRLALEGRLALAGLIISALILIAASALGWPLGAPTCAAAVIATCVVTAHDHRLPLQVAKGVSWSVIPLVAGLFMIVEALQGAGMLALTKSGLLWASHLGHVPGNLVTAFSVGLLSNGMNNLPMGLIGGSAVQSLNAPGNLDHAVLLGVDLGPNLTVTGSLATILWLIALRREKVEITARQFFRVGLLAMPLALLAGILVLR